MAEYEADKAYLRVLQHRAIANTTDLDELERIATNGKSERHRLRAAAILAKHRKDMAHLSAYHGAHREETLPQGRQGVRRDAVP